MKIVLICPIYIATVGGRFTNGRNIFIGFINFSDFFSKNLFGHVSEKTNEAEVHQLKVNLAVITKTNKKGAKGI